MAIPTHFSLSPFQILLPFLPYQSPRTKQNRRRQFWRRSERVRKPEEIGEDLAGITVINHERARYRVPGNLIHDNDQRSSYTYSIHDESSPSPACFQTNFHPFFPHAPSITRSNRSINRDINSRRRWSRVGRGSTTIERKLLGRV